jgi:hypothetical protein
MTSAGRKDRAGTQGRVEPTGKPEAHQCLRASLDQPDRRAGRREFADTADRQQRAVVPG